MARLIDADALREDWLENGQNEYVYDTNAFLQSIDEQPTIEAEPVRYGEWVLVDTTYDVYTCSECGGFAPSGFIKTNYCPKCGAKMDGKEKEE